MVVGVAAFVLLGYIACVVPARRWHRDIGSFRRSLWVGYGNRDHWRAGIVLAYLAFGWPSLVVALRWRTGTTRAALVELRADMRAEAHEQR